MALNKKGFYKYFVKYLQWGHHYDVKTSLIKQQTKKPGLGSDFVPGCLSCDLRSALLLRGVRKTDLGRDLGSDLESDLGSDLESDLESVLESDLESDLGKLPAFELCQAAPPAVSNPAGASPAARGQGHFCQQAEIAVEMKRCSRSLGDFSACSDGAGLTLLGEQ